ncbi:MAG TPA: DNA polymerase Y family protein [Verrucomicrobiae bacterium]|jgi:protein ImuB|nr:DNA polymerase Y family protein [Verrucomicrobiae bacterium]
MFAVIYLPQFHLQAVWRQEPELRASPLAVMDDAEPKAAVMELSAAGRAAGVSLGQTSTQARARCPEIVLRPRSRAQEEAIAGMLLQGAFCFSPRIEATAPHVCTLDLQGMPLLATFAQNCASVEDWAQRIVAAFDQMRLSAQVGVAETPFLAWQAAQLGRPISCAGAAEEIVAALSLEKLGLPTAILDRLERWGIGSVNAFLALGREKIAERLGVEAAEIHDGLRGRESRPLKLVTPPETFEEFLEFELPVETIEPLLFVLRRFVEELSRRLGAIYLVAQELKLQLGLAVGAPYERLFVIPAPTSEVEALFRIVHTHLENVRTEAPIQSLRLSARPGRSGQYQFGLFETALRNPNQFHETLARLGALLGSDRVGSPRLRATHRPDSFEMEVSRMANGVFGEEESAGEPSQVCGLALRRFRPPLPAVVELRENRPAWLRSSWVSGPIIALKGPVKISGSWWDEKRWAREEWEAQTRDGGLCRLAREQEHWFIDGIFD